MTYIILVIQLIWIGEVFRRFPKDLREFRETDQWTLRGVHLLIWAVAVYFCVAVLLFIRLLTKPLLELV